MPKKIDLPLTNGAVATLSADRILCNDINLPHDPGYKHGSSLYVLSSTYGPMGAVWAKGEEDAVDELIDADLGKAIQVDQEDEGTAVAGNNSVPVDLTHLQIFKVKLSDYGKHVALFAEARGAGADTLADL